MLPLFTLCCAVRASACRAVIEMLVTKNKGLKKNLSLAGSLQNELKDSSITEQFKELIERRLGHSMLGLHSLCSHVHNVFDVTNYSKTWPSHNHGHLLERIIRNGPQKK